MSEESKARLYEIWSESYKATGEKSLANYHATIRGTSFKDACKNYAKANEDFNEYFIASSMTLWGCRLYPDQNSAQASCPDIWR